MQILGKPDFGKKIRVVFADEPSRAYKELKALVGKERTKGITSSENQTLLRGINNTIEILRSNTQYGSQLPKPQIPKSYVELYEVENLWVIELPLYWRLVYTVTSSGEVEIINLILDIYDHPTYDKVFHYKKK